MTRVKRHCALALLATAAGVCSAPSFAARTLTWSETADSLSRGSADGIAVTDAGALFVAPRLSAVGNDLPPGQPVLAWSMAADSRGNIYLGTGPDGVILKIASSGKQEIFQRLDEPMVTALAIDAAGRLLAATSPGGRIYRIDGDGSGTLWSETGARYIWDLAVMDGGTTYAAAGEPGVVFAIDRNGMSRTFFDSHDQHVMSLARLKNDDLLAGSAGNGRVYRVDSKGHGVVLYEDELPEVVSVAVGPDGSAFAALVAAPRRAVRRPAVRIALPGGVTATAPSDAMGAIEEQDGATVRGVIEGLPGSEVAPGAAIQGRVVRIDADGNVSVVWRSADEAPFALTTDADGRPLLGTGEPARLYRIGSTADENEVARLTSLGEGQLTGLLRLGRSTFMATSNPAALYRMESNAAEGGSFMSRTFDAGTLARWGAIRWIVAGDGGRVEFFTRSGNSSRPDASWSPWSPTLVDPGGSDVVNPDGRYLQWRVRFVGPASGTPRVSSVDVLYEPYNRPPEIREFFVDAPQAAIAGDVTLRWVAIDPDRDPLDVTVEFRGESDTDWTTLRRPAPETFGGDPDEATQAPTDPPAVRWGRERVTLRTADLAEGRYEFRIALSDQPGNPPGEGREVRAPQPVALTIDRSAPEISVRPNGGAFDITVVDRHSPVGRLEIAVDGATRFSLRPLDGVCDSHRESFRFTPPTGQAVVWSARGVDAAGNTAVEPLGER